MPKSPPVVQGDVTLIPLTKGAFAKIDTEDLPLVSSLTWCLGPGYAVSRPKADGPAVWMHRLLLGVTDRSLQVDHINHDALDNRRTNLRVCTNAQNQMNARPTNRNRSGFRGVYWDKKWGWTAQVRTAGKKKQVGGFTTPVEAAQEYDRLAVTAHGEFALTNRKLGLL